MQRYEKIKSLQAEADKRFPERAAERKRLKRTLEKIQESDRNGVMGILRRQYMEAFKKFHDIWTEPLQGVFNTTFYINLNNSPIIVAALKRLEALGYRHEGNNILNLQKEVVEEILADRTQ